MASGGAYNVKVSVTGGDAATKELQKLNKEMAAAQKPANDYAKALKKYEDLSGITKQRTQLAEADKAHRASIKQTLGSVGKLGEQLTSVAGTALKASGAILGLGALGSVAGIVGLSKQFATSSIGLTNMSRNLGLTTDQLLNYHNAAAMVGVSSESLDSAFHAAGQKMQDAVSGRDGTLAATMKGVLHIDPTAGVFKAKTFAEQSDQIFAAISKISDPRLQENVLNMFGAGSLLPIVQNLGQYRQALKDTASDSRSYSGEGLKLYRSFTGLSQASEQLGRTISDTLGPALDPFIIDVTDLVKQFDKWLTANKDIIDTDLKAWLKPVDDGLKSFATWLKTASVDEVAGDVKKLGVALAVIAALPVASSVLSIASSFWKLGASLTVACPELLAASAAIGAIYLAWDRTKGALDDYNDAEKKYLAEKAARENPTAQATYDARGEARTLPPNLQANYDASHGHGKYAGHRATGGTARGPIDLSAYNGSQAKAFASLAAMGYNPNHAAGIVSSLISESGLKPNAVGDSGLAYGIGQWHGDRQAIFKQVFGHDIKGSSLEEQLRFVDYELHHSEKHALDKLNAASSAYDSGAAVSRYYERPRAVEEAANNRGILAQQLAQQHLVNGDIKAHITVAGNTQGVTASASSSGAAFKTAPLVNMQMPSAMSP